MIKLSHLFFILLMSFLNYYYFFSNNSYSEAYVELLSANNIANNDDIYPLESDFYRQKYERSYYFFLNRLLYFDDTGQIKHSIRTGEDEIITACNYGYAIYKKVGDSISVYDRHGYPLWIYESHSYPIISPNGKRIAFLSTDNRSIQILDNNRNTVLPFSFVSSMILYLSFSTFGDNLMLSTSDGQFIVYDYNGKEKIRHQHTKSLYNIVKSHTSSKKGNYYAILAGADPEYLTLLDNNGAVLWSVLNRGESEQARTIYIDEANQCIILKNNKTVIFRNISDGEIQFIYQIPEEIKDINYILFSSVKDKILCLLNGKNNLVAILIDKDGNLLWKKEFFEKYFLHGGFASDAKSFQIQTSQYIYNYRYHPSH